MRRTSMREGRLPLRGGCMRVNSSPFEVSKRRRSGMQVALVPDTLERELRLALLSEVRLNTTVDRVDGDFPDFRIRLNDGSMVNASSIVVATGFTPFDPTSLKEYGYGT